MTNTLGFTKIHLSPMSKYAKDEYVDFAINSTKYCMPKHIVKNIGIFAPLFEDAVDKNQLLEFETDTTTQVIDTVFDIISNSSAIQKMEQVDLISCYNIISFMSYIGVDKVVTEECASALVGDMTLIVFLEDLEKLPANDCLDDLCSALKIFPRKTRHIHKYIDIINASKHGDKIKTRLIKKIINVSYQSDIETFDLRLAIINDPGTLRKLRSDNHVQCIDFKKKIATVDAISKIYKKIFADTETSHQILFNNNTIVGFKVCGKSVQLIDFELKSNSNYFGGNLYATVLDHIVSIKVGLYEL